MSHLHEVSVKLEGFKPVRVSIGRFEFPEAFTVLRNDRPDDVRFGKMVLTVTIVDGSGGKRHQDAILEPNT